MFSQNALDNAQRLFKALAAREANLDAPIPDDRIMDAAAQIGLEGDEWREVPSEIETQMIVKRRFPSITRGTSQ